MEIGTFVNYSTLDDDVSRKKTNDSPAADMVNSPKHYTSHPSGIECIEITRHYDFDIGNAIKYLWRAGLKADSNMNPVDKQIQDLEKAIWYINDEIKQLKQKKENN